MSFLSKYMSKKTNIPEHYFTEGDSKLVKEYKDPYQGDVTESLPKDLDKNGKKKYICHEDFSFDALDKYPQNVRTKFINAIKLSQEMRSKNDEQFEMRLNLSNGVFAFMIEEGAKMKEKNDINYHPSLAVSVQIILTRNDLEKKVLSKAIEKGEGGKKM